MKYEAEIDGIHKLIEIEQKNGLVHANVDNRKYELTVVHPEAGVYLLFVGASVYEARVSELQEDFFSVEVGCRTFSARFIDRKHRRSSVEGSEAGQQLLTAPMPGKVIRVLVRRGDQVEAGQGVLIVEAMKMQNEVKSPKSGQLLELKVGEGDTVTANQILAIVE
jgi:biotin carboxyl carrier protein